MVQRVYERTLTIDMNGLLKPGMLIHFPENATHLILANLDCKETEQERSAGFKEGGGGGCGIGQTVRRVE